jgi:hypothetical protein
VHFLIWLHDQCSKHDREKACHARIPSEYPRFDLLAPFRTPKLLTEAGDAPGRDREGDQAHQLIEDDAYFFIDRSVGKSVSATKACTLWDTTQSC